MGATEERFHLEIKGRFRKRVVLANVPSFRFFVPGEHANVPSFRGTCERTLVPVFVPREHPPKPPFCNPPFCVLPKDFSGRYGFSTTGLESFSLRPKVPQNWAKRFSFGGGRVRFFLLCYCAIWLFFVSEVFEKGLAVRGGCREEIPLPEIEASFLYLFSYARLGEGGTHYWRLFGAVFGRLFVANALKPTLFRNLCFLPNFWVSTRAIGCRVPMCFPWRLLRATSCCQP